MKHNIDELYTVHNFTNSKTFYATRAYIEAHDIPVVGYKGNTEDLFMWARQMSYRNNNGKPFSYIDVDAVREAWQYGEKSYFDSALELSTYREQVAGETDLARRKKKALAEIMAQFENLSLDTLERLARTSLV